MNFSNLSWSLVNCVNDIIKNNINTTQLTPSDAFNIFATAIVLNLFLLHNRREMRNVNTYGIEINMNNEEKREICRCVDV